MYQDVPRRQLKVLMEAASVRDRHDAHGARGALGQGARLKEFFAEGAVAANIEGAAGGPAAASPHSLRQLPVVRADAGSPQPAAGVESNAYVRPVVLGVLWPWVTGGHLEPLLRGVEHQFAHKVKHVLLGLLFARRPRGNLRRGLAAREEVTKPIAIGLGQGLLPALPHVLGDACAIALDQELLEARLPLLLRCDPRCHRAVNGGRCSVTAP
mmetsp:Transcript_89363/g.253204  ORF Transcript_89363/g.253204 Transcript_89363/m.253204 type:complete len:212 (-) Transcript_89363:12-647(-)